MWPRSRVPDAESYLCISHELPVLIHPHLHLRALSSACLTGGTAPLQWCILCRAHHLLPPSMVGKSMPSTSAALSHPLHCVPLKVNERKACDGHVPLVSCHKLAQHHGPPLFFSSWLVWEDAIPQNLHGVQPHWECQQ
jgi:hypothetical protein